MAGSRSHGKRAPRSRGRRHPRGCSTRLNTQVPIQPALPLELPNRHPIDAASETTRGASRSQEEVSNSADDTAARSTLATFFHDGLQTHLQCPALKLDNPRIAYVGTATSNIVHLFVNLTSDDAVTTHLHVPFPSIRPCLPWKPDFTRPDLQWYTRVDEELSKLPPKPLRDAIVKAYFQKIHPGFPIVDEKEFKRQYEDPEHLPPLLILQSVLLAGAHVCDDPAISQDRFAFQSLLYKRATTLFNLRHENDRVTLVQSCLLFAWFPDGADDVSANAYYWVGVGIRIAYGLGMHRDLSQGAVSRMTASERRRFRRIWWAFVQLDVLSSLHHGRPTMISPDSYDQPLLTEDDYVDVLGDGFSDLNVQFCIQQAGLCQILIEIIQLMSPGAIKRFSRGTQSFQATVSEIEASLLSWYMDLPPLLSATGTRNTSFWSYHLQIHYNFALLVLHRGVDALPSGIASPEQRTKSQQICPAVTTSLLELFEGAIITSGGDPCSLWFSSVSVLFAASISIASELDSYFCAQQHRPTVLTLQTHRKLERVLLLLHEVASYWPVADAVHKIFSSIRSASSMPKLKTIRRQLAQRMSPTIMRSQEAETAADGLAIGSPPPPRPDLTPSYGTSTFSPSHIGADSGPDLLSWPGWQDILGTGSVPVYATEPLPSEYGWPSL